MSFTPELRIQLLGIFSLHYGLERIVDLPSVKAQALLAYLLLHSKAPQSRQSIAYLFWSESSEAQSRTNLRQTLHHLRQRLPDADKFVQADSKNLRWNQDALFRLDVADFTEMLKAAVLAEQSNDQRLLITCLQQALEIYGGELLPGCYEEWIFPERERLQQQAIQALEKLVILLEANQNYDAAIAYGQRLLKIDSLHEPTYRLLMKLFLAKGDRASALRTYHRCCAVFQQELDTEPSPATVDAYKHILKLEAMPSPKAGTAETPVLQAATTCTRLAVATPLVGRVNEWVQLQSDWQYALSGKARLVLIRGEAGIGKSRLAEELMVECSERCVSTARTRCYAAEGRLAYAPLTEWLRSLAIRPGLKSLDKIWLSELTRLLPELLTEYPELSRAQPLNESWQRQNFYEALVQAFQVGGTADINGQSPQPLLLVIDDLQWCDSETLGWLQYFLRTAAQQPVLIVGTARSEEIGDDHPLTQLLRSLHRDEQVTEIALAHLDAQATTTLASHVANTEFDSNGAIALYQQTEGHPLYIVEMIRANLLEGFRQPTAASPENASTVTITPASGVAALPPKIKSILTARLAQLSPSARQLVGLTAAVGRNFTIEILQQASGDKEEEIVNGLDELWHYRIIRDQGPDAYDFSHDKLREVAYESISRPRRRLLHRRIAESLETIHHSDLDTVSAQIAAHYEKAGLLSKAVPYYLQAAEVAQRIYANTEAIQAFQQALKLLQTMPLTTRRLEQELALHTRLGVSLVAVEGYGSLEVKAVYEQARALAQSLGQPSSPPVIRALAITAIVQGDLQLALELGQQMLAVAADNDDTILAVESHYVMGVTMFWLGDFSASRHYLECAIDRYQPEYQQNHLTLYAQDPYVICLSRLAFTLWCLGCLDEALEVSHIAVTKARQLSHPFSLAYTLTWTTLLHSHRRDMPMTAQYAAEVIALSEDKQLGIWLAIGHMLQGWTNAYTDDIGAAIQQMEAALEMLQNIGARFVQPYFLSLLADAYGRQGDFDAALDLIQRAHEVMEHSGERWVEAELYWRHGELLRGSKIGRGGSSQKAPDSTVQSCFEQAVAIAQAQGAKLLELQATVSWSELSETPRLSNSLSNWLQQTLSSTPSEREPLIVQRGRTLFRTL
jgi:DNA-binding SARP family transcriptional activator/predicted ATPase